MYFGQVKVTECVNGILAHTVTLDGKKFLKGRIISKEDQKYFIQNNLEYLICAKLTKNDIHEDNAANILAKMFNNNTLALEKAFTGRANILANELKVGIKVSSGPVLDKPGDLAGLLTK